MEEQEALDVASRAAEESGWVLDDYEAPTARRDGGRWIVFFKGREPRPGNHFMVYVDAETGATEVWPGK